MFRLLANLGPPETSANIEKGWTNPVVWFEKMSSQHIRAASDRGQKLYLQAAAAAKKVFPNGAILCVFAWSLFVMWSFPGPAVALCLADLVRTIMHDVVAREEMLQSKSRFDLDPPPAAPVPDEPGSWKKSLKRPFSKRTWSSTSKSSLASNASSTF